MLSLCESCEGSQIKKREGRTKRESLAQTLFRQAESLPPSWPRECEALIRVFLRSRSKRRAL